MKRTLIALAVLALLGAPAFALTLAEGDTIAKFRDHSSLYLADGSPVGLPAGGTPVWGAGGDVSSLGITQRTIFQLTTIYDENGNIEYAAGPGNPEEITGVMVNLLLVRVTPVLATSEVILDFAAIGTPNLAVYYDTTPDYDPDPGVNAGNLQNVLPAGSVAIPAAGGPNDWTTPTTFPTVTDGALWLGGNMVDLASLTALGVALPNFGAPILPGVVLRERLDISTGLGSGFAYVDLTSGSFLPWVVQGYVKDQFGNPTIADAALNFDLYTPLFNPVTGNWQDTLSYVGPGYWPVDSQDPASFAVVPEPMTLGLIGLGLAGLGLRRRKMAA